MTDYLFQKGKIDGFAETCELVESHYPRLTHDVASIVMMWRRFVGSYMPFGGSLRYKLGYCLGVAFAYDCFGGSNAKG